jgi:Na+/proline symporter
VTSRSVRTGRSEPVIVEAFSRGLDWFRPVAALYAGAVVWSRHESMDHPWVAFTTIAVLMAFSLALLAFRRRTTWLLAIEVVLAVGGIFATLLADSAEAVAAGGFTLPTIWAAGCVAGAAVLHGRLGGLVVAAIVAAAMSTVSGSLNSLSAATTHDIYLPLTGRSADDPGLLRVGKLFTLLWAVILVGGALLYRAEGTPVVIVALAIASFTYGGLLGGFFLGMLWKRAIQRDAITGMAIAIVTMAVVVFAKQLAALIPSLAGPLTPISHVAWPWYVLIGTLITLIVGMLSSFTHPAPVAVSDDYTYDADRSWTGRRRVEDSRSHR